MTDIQTPCFRISKPKQIKPRTLLYNVVSYEWCTVRYAVVPEFVWADWYNKEYEEKDNILIDIFATVINFHL
jgi:hypothetical protein